MRPIRHVLHIVPALFGADGGVLGGAERYALELARHMAEEVPTTLVSFADSARRATVGRLEVHVLGGATYVRGQRTNPVAAGLLGEIRRADVVHCHQQHVVASSLAALACRATGRRVFVSDLGGGGWDVSSYVSTDRWYHGHLHISEYSRTVFGHAGQPWAHVILGGVDTEKFSPDTSVPRDGPVLFVGRLLPHKGVDYLIEAVPPGMPLAIIGSALDAEYLRYLHTLAAGKDVTFRHDCGDVALVRAYQRARCVVLPSVYRNVYGRESKVPELLGQTLLEGMACGAPAVCTAVASMPEVVVDGVTGIIAPPNDPAALRQALCQMTTQRERADALGRAGRERVLERFTWPAVVRRCMEVYAQ
ncbi:MAG: glycosyltransferase family 4 protein [Gemmatimonadaceae bacterium]